MGQSHPVLTYVFDHTFCDTHDTLLKKNMTYNLYYINSKILKILIRLTQTYHFHNELDNLYP